MNGDPESGVQTQCPSTPHSSRETIIMQPLTHNSVSQTTNVEAHSPPSYSQNNLPTDDVVMTVKSSKIIVPAFPMPMAIVLFILNILVPGLGTFIGAIGQICCADTSFLVPNDMVEAFCLQMGIAAAQLCLTFLFLIGWVWSLIWGLAFMWQSRDMYKKSMSEISAMYERNNARGSSVHSSAQFHRQNRVSPMVNAPHIPNYEDAMNYPIHHPTQSFQTSSTDGPSLTMPTTSSPPQFYDDDDLPPPYEENLPHTQAIVATNCSTIQQESSVV